MKRTKKVKKEQVAEAVAKPVPQVRLWKKLGGGSLRANGKIYKQNQVFPAFADEIPENFKNIIVDVSGTTKVLKDATDGVLKDTPGPVYTMKPRGKSPIWFDVINPAGKVMNDSALTKNKAQEFIEDLNK